MTTAKIRQVLAIVSTLNLAADGEPVRTIESSDQLDLVLVKRFAAAIAPGRAPITVKSLLMALRRNLLDCRDRTEDDGQLRSACRRISQWVGRIPKPTGKRHNTRR